MVMGAKERAARRRKRMVVNAARSHDQAEQWDLEYWQSKTPQERLSALVEIHRDIERIRNRNKSIEEW